MLTFEEMPEDYRRLLDDAGGPGTLAGVLRLLAPDGPVGFDMRTEQQRHPQPDPCAQEWGVPDALLWGVFDSGETCWWLPIRDTPSRWLLVVVGRGRQQLNISTTEFLHRWIAGDLDLPVLSLPPVARSWVVTPAGEPVAANELPSVDRDPVAQLATIIGPSDSAAPTYDWLRIEGELGSLLPADYKRLFESYGPVLVLNGIFVSAPDELVSMHEECVDDESGVYEVGSGPGGLLMCASTEARALLCWDTGVPAADSWPVVDFDTGRVFAGTLTELLVAELTGVGINATAIGLGDPAEWVWPIWGPDEPW